MGTQFIGGRVIRALSFSKLTKWCLCASIIVGLELLAIALATGAFAQVQYFPAQKVQPCYQTTYPCDTVVSPTNQLPTSATLATGSAVEVLDSGGTNKLSVSAGGAAKTSIDQSTPGTTNGVSDTNFPATVATGTGAQGATVPRITVATDSATVAGSAPGSAGSPNVQVGVNPVSLAVTDLSGSVTTGGTFQTLDAAAARNSFEFENTCNVAAAGACAATTDNCYLSFRAATFAKATSVLVVPGAYYGRTGVTTPSSLISVTCDGNGDKFWAQKQ